MHCDLAMLARVISRFQKNWQFDIGRGSSLLGAHALPARPVIRPDTVWEETCERSFGLTTFFIMLFTYLIRRQEAGCRFPAVISGARCPILPGGIVTGNHTVCWERPTSLAKLSSPSERVLSTCVDRGERSRPSRRWHPWTGLRHFAPSPFHRRASWATGARRHRARVTASAFLERPVRNRGPPWSVGTGGVVVGRQRRRRRRLKQKNRNRNTK